MKNYWVIRYGLAQNSTLGFWTRNPDDGLAQRVCFNLEDERRVTKVWGETCIPTGSYDLKLNTEHMDNEEWMNGKYRKRFGDRHKGMVEITNIKDFTNVYVHIGNEEDETAGCFLPGILPRMNENGEFSVGRSADAYWILYEEIVPFLIAGERVVLHVTEIQPWA